MANFIPSKKEASDFNNGVQYVNGDSVQAETVNNLVENALYTQAQAASANALVDSVVTDAFAPPLVGMHHIQFSGEPTPAEIWGGTTWEIDTAYQGKTLIGSGGSYTLGATGGAEKHTMTASEMVTHRHSMRSSYGQQMKIQSRYGSQNVNGIVGLGTNSGYSEIPSGGVDVIPETSDEGGGNAFSIMQPYTVVNYWKRIG